MIVCGLFLRLILRSTTSNHDDFTATMARSQGVHVITNLDLNSHRESEYERFSFAETPLEYCRSYHGYFARSAKKKNTKVNGHECEDIRPKLVAVRHRNAAAHYSRTTLSMANLGRCFW